jgi:predicted TIM-barrel fold metal-dependent hydrolase
MEAVVQDKATPPRFRILSSRNPPTLKANIAALERLLAHNRDARIVWAHVGSDHTGDMTVPLLKRLLEAHLNLYMQLKIDNPPPSFPQNRPLDQNGRLRPEWLDLIRAFPDRFVLGSDTFYTPSGVFPSEANLNLLQSLLAQLPPDLALKVGFQNAAHIYNLR